MQRGAPLNLLIRLEYFAGRVIWLHCCGASFICV